MKANKNTDLNKFKSIPFWSWNDELEVDKLIPQIDWMHENGMGGFFMHARSGLSTKYLSEKWMQCVEACSEHAKKLGMQAWIYDENGWPSGFVGGKLLEDEENRDRYLTYSVGAYDKNATVSYLDDGKKLVRSNGEADGIYINVFVNIATSTVDILNPEVTRKFISETHEVYKKRYGDKFTKEINGFFTDEPQYYRAGWPFTPMLIGYFKENYGEDVFDSLGLLFFKREGYREFRYKFWSAMQQLMLKNFGKQLYDWCDDNGVQLTGHYVEEVELFTQMMCCAGVMPFYEYEHIPGFDWLGRYCKNTLAPKQLLSVKEQLGFEHALCETYGCCGWDVTPRELKNLTEVLYINGVDKICQHCVPYSEKGMRMHDYPAHYSEVNPWVKNNFKDFNEYFTQLGALLAESKEIVHTAVLHPIRSAYFDYMREPVIDDHFEGVEKGEGTGIDALENGFKAFREKIDGMAIPYHYVDETLLAKHGSVNGSKLRCGLCEYDYLIIPRGVVTMDEATERLIKEYVENGGKVILDGDKPEYVTWKPYSYDYLTTNATYDEILSADGYTFKSEGGELRVSPRKIGDKTIFFVVNSSLTDDCVVNFDFGGKYTSFEKSYIGSENIEIVPTEFKLRPNESAMFVPSNETPQDKSDYEIFVPAAKYEVVGSEPNSYSIDMVSISTDGVNYEEPACLPLLFLDVLKRRHEGDLYLKYAFDIKTLPTNVFFKFEIPRILGVSVNGVDLGYKGEEVFNSPNIAEHLHIGNNEVVLKLDYFQSEHVYNVLFGENITESLLNCLFYDSEFEPLILKGDFGVYERDGLKPGRYAPNVKLGKNFVIDTPKAELDSLLEGGYIFFAGKMTLRQKFTVNSNKVMFKLPFRWHIADVRINGKFAGRMVVDNVLDISEFVKAGENELEIDIVIGNRNLHGPHHHINEEFDFVVRGMFRFDDNHAPSYSEMCSFVEPLIDFNAQYLVDIV